MKLQIITPEKMVFSGDVQSVTLPGVKGLFSLLENHASLVSALSKGEIIYKSGEKEDVFAIESGFVEVNNNVANVCVETI